MKSNEPISMVLAIYCERGLLGFSKNRRVPQNSPHRMWEVNRSIDVHYWRGRCWKRNSDYINKGRDIKVGIYDEIVNIASRCGLPNTLTMETLLDGRSEIRNRVIARVFKELGYVEQWGSGIQCIKSACLAAGLAEPRIREKGDFVDVEFYRPAPDSAEKVPDTAGLEEQPGQCRPIPPDSARYRPIGQRCIQMNDG